MFTGIVAAKGRVLRALAFERGARLELEAPVGALLLGESVCVSGVCLTVAALVDGGFAADLSAETLERTTLGRLEPGSPVNLERALRSQDRLGGHFVTGHVDAVVRVKALVPVGEALRVDVEGIGSLTRFVAVKGSVALEGVSLTVNEVHADGFSVMLIPHTLGVTTLAELTAGAPLNLEVDLLMRYVARWLEATSPAP